jgi:hypothetical protein
MPKNQKPPLFAESTEVPASKSASEVVALLVRAGATSINHNLEKQRLVAISFVIPIANMSLPYKLPVRVEPVFQRVNGRRDNYSQSAMAARDREQAERIAWRHAFWWLKSQLALIELGMVQAAEVFMPYMIDGEGRTFFEVHGPKLLGPGEAQKATQ